MENKKDYTIKTEEEFYILVNEEIKRLKLNRNDLNDFEKVILGLWTGGNPYDEK